MLRPSQTYPVTRNSFCAPRRHRSFSCGHDSDSNLVARSVAPSNPLLGVMLPYTPLHHLLLDALGFPVVATSGNRSGEPIVADEDEALRRLGGLADVFLVHDRPILRPVDDSVVRVMAGHVTVLRLARGYAPLPLAAPSAGAPRLALGGHQKNAVAIAVGRQVILGPHIGDLDERRNADRFSRAVEALTSLYGVHPDVIACDEHPDYYSTRLAGQLGPAGPPRAASSCPCARRHGRQRSRWAGARRCLGWDGLWQRRHDLGRRVSDGRRGQATGAPRISLPFRLPGGEAAVREPRRAALGALYAVFGEEAFAMADMSSGRRLCAGRAAGAGEMLARGVNSPVTSSAGRLFDAVAADPRSFPEGQLRRARPRWRSSSPPSVPRMPLRFRRLQ